MKKILFIQDFYQESDVKNKKVFSSKLSRSFIDTIKDFDVELYFATVYPILDTGETMPTAEQTREYKPKLIQKVFDINPDIIVPMGAYTMKILTGNIAFMSEVGSPTHYDSLNKEPINFTLLPIPHPEKVTVYPSLLDKINRALGALVREIKSTTVSNNVTDSVIRNVDYQPLETIEDIENAFSLMNKEADIIAFDTETTGLDAFANDSKLICLSLSYKERQGYVIPLEHPESPFKGQELNKVVQLIKKFLANDISKVAHNGKFDIQWLKVIYDIDVNHFDYDTQYMHYLAVSEEKGTQGLKYNATLYTDMGNYEQELTDYIKTLPPDIRYNYGNVPWKILRKYAMADTDVCLRLFHKFKPLIDANEDWKWLLENCYMPVAKALNEIEITGMHFDKELASYYGKTYAEELARIESQLNNHPAVIEIENEKRALFAERERIKKIPKKERTAEEQEKFTKYKKYENYTFSWTSTDNLRCLLFDKLGLPVVARTDKGEPSTDEDSLQKLATKHEVPKLLLERRKIGTLKQGFVDKLPTMVAKGDLIHPRFSVHMTQTGRTTCENPRIA